MENLFLCPSVSQLKELDLTGVTLSNFNPEPLQVLLENISATLHILLLKDYWITDSQLSVILSTLSHCHQLMTFNFCGNQISKAILENLIHHTIGLRKLSLEIYPAPWECYYYDFEDNYWERFLQLQVGNTEGLQAAQEDHVQYHPLLSVWPESIL
ncbi:PREDICTED: PRAME family member 12-like [Propithecus coquereli]|uniref:PRAME family member 12-like n=1 Tax=Propithecus coquereli TaxID=379532 RepID=UPI00063F6036|nr:PREDICTED: PRAME family member 12-like [Propithecus coquereli]